MFSAGFLPVCWPVNGGLIGLNFINNVNSSLLGKKLLYRLAKICCIVFIAPKPVGVYKTEKPEKKIFPSGLSMHEFLDTKE
jgi:hypothetical protein